MKVEQAKAVEVPEELVCASGGAKVGDTIIFSPHHPKNAHLVDGYHYIKCNMPYVVTRINQSAGPHGSCHASWEYPEEDGTTSRSSYNAGHYDVIIRAPRTEPEKPAFRPVTLTLENQAEVDFITSLIGCTSCDTIPYKAWDQLEDLSSKVRRKVREIIWY